MKLSMKSLAALLMMLNGAVMASENVNTPENHQFLKQQENLSRQLREKPDHQRKRQRSTVLTLIYW
ncbi:conjugal transfer pilus assembly protein TrbC [Escherichia coli]|nr:conjugal transfer pilus assembly protein TrbC [Escherichia coli]